jgi:hypothetical protein
MSQSFRLKQYVGTEIIEGDLVTNGGLFYKNVQTAAGASAGSVTISKGVPGLILTGTGGITGYTVTLPVGPKDGQVVFITTTQAISATLLVNGGTIVPTAPTTLTAGQSLRYMYNLATTSWYQI